MALINTKTFDELRADWLVKKQKAAAQQRLNDEQEQQKLLHQLNQAIQAKLLSPLEQANFPLSEQENRTFSDLPLDLQVSLREAIVLTWQELGFEVQFYTDSLSHQDGYHIDIKVPRSAP